MIPGLNTQLNVVGALLLRETRTRFGDQQLGYLWAILSPLLMILTFVAMISFGGRSAPDGMSAAGFIGTGMIPFFTFQNTLGRVVSSISSNKALLYYPQVYPLDLAIARSLLEVATCLSVFAIILGADAAWAGTLKVDNILHTLMGLLLAGALGASLGLVLCAGTVFMPALEQLWGPVMRPLFWISGIFFTANDLPTPALKFFQYNPVLHAIELVRDGWFPSYTSRVADPLYPIWWILTLSFIGLTLERMARPRIELA